MIPFYVPFNNTGYPVAAQRAIGHAELLCNSYADYKKQIVEEMTHMFADYGFNAHQDITSIVLNRWIHAHISPQQGFYFSESGNDVPIEIVKRTLFALQLKVTTSR